MQAVLMQAVLMQAALLKDEQIFREKYNFKKYFNVAQHGCQLILLTYYFY